MHRMNAPDFAAIGECMIELSESGNAGATRRTFGGDTLNTAVYAARSLAGSRLGVHYVTVLGDDPYSGEMLDAWQAEGINTDLVERLGDALPGLYMIRTDAGGERSFHYWRAQAAARQLFMTPGADKRIETLASARMVYFSGITLGILPEAGRNALFTLLQNIRKRGGQVAFDSNYRSRLWPNASAAREAITAALRFATIALPSFVDEAQLFGDAGPGETAARLRAAGVPEVVVTNGPEPYIIECGNEKRTFPPPRIETPVDTTAAGDAFNGSYLAARLQGMTPVAAAERGAALAARVIRYPGAIMPREEPRPD